MVGEMESFSVKTVGASHIAKNTSCQDFAFSESCDQYSLAVISDGHGGSDYFRSDRGSAFAVKAFCECVEMAFSDEDSEGSNGNLASILAHVSKREESEVFHQLVTSIVYRWHILVDEDIKKAPFCLEEMSDVNEKTKEKYLSGEYLDRAYGATLIGIVVVPGSFWFGIHIGDGKCVAFDLNGEASEPIPWDDRCFLNTTSSICDNDAIARARFFFSRSIPTAVFVASDGVDDCFKRDKDLYDFYRQIICGFVSTAKNEAVSDLNEYLPRMSESGSLDDISIAGIMNIEYLREHMVCFSKKKENCLKVIRVGNLGAEDSKDYLQRGLVFPAEIGTYSFQCIGCNGFGFGETEFKIVQSDFSGLEMIVGGEHFLLSDDSNLHTILQKRADSFDVLIFSFTRK